MAAITLPRLPKLPKLSGTQALLLTGGAFVLAVSAWFFSNAKLVRDWSGSTPEGSVISATILGGRPSDWAAFKDHLPEGARIALKDAKDRGSTTLFAVYDADGELDWHLLETSEKPPKHWALRLVPKDVSILGRISVGGRETPFAASIGHGLIRARVGRAFRGINIDPRPFDAGRRLIVPLDQQSAYIEKPAGASWVQVSKILSSNLQRFHSQAVLWSLPGSLEVAVSASETRPLNPFLIYYKDGSGDDRSSSRLENYAKTLLSESEPVRFSVSMPDDSKMTELRLDPDSVMAVRKNVGDLGYRTRLSSPGNSGVIDLFSAKNGESWLSDDLGLIQGALVSNVGAKQPGESCEKPGKDGFIALSGKGVQILPYFKGLERLTFSFHSLESGMFTTCGYFMD